MNKDIREIEEEIDIFHKDLGGFNYSKGTAILNILRCFEDGCRLLGMYEISSSGHKEKLEMNNRYYLDAADMAIKWAYEECNDDNSIDFTCDERYILFALLLSHYAKPYVDICSAYISYSRGYFNATVKDNIVSFSLNRPISKIVHADYSVEIKEKATEFNLNYFNNISDFVSIKKEIISAIKIKDAHVDYLIPPIVWEKTKKVLEYQYISASELPRDWVVDGFTLGEYSEIWVALATWMMIHSIACLHSGISGGALQDVVVTKTISEIIEFIGNRISADRSIIKKVIELLVFDPSIRNNDVIYQPIIGFTTKIYALAPNLFLNSNLERNIISLINKFQDKKEYSTFTNKREALMGDEILSQLGDTKWYVKPQVNIPSPLPDVDLLLLDAKNNAILLCELKWLNSADSTSEVYARQDDIDKGVKQSEKTFKYFSENLQEGLKRAFGKEIINSVNCEKIVIGACVISKNTIRTTLDSIPVINSDQFTEICITEKNNLRDIVNELKSRRYLLKLPNKYVEEIIPIEYADYIFEVPAITFDNKIDSRKIGRNEPCPCEKINPHTGKIMKYKKCCGRNN